LPLLAPPGGPDDRQTALRRAFDRMAGDKDYIASVEKIGFAVDAMPGEKLAGFIKEHFSPTDDLIERLRKATAPQN
jgi:hypothetical protein